MGPGTRVEGLALDARPSSLDSSHFLISLFPLSLILTALVEQLDNISVLNQVTVPDLWQQEAVTALRT